MCCVFTCCGWMIDLIQRVWTFAMSCCISSAICCLLVSASLAGIALGYNYSLAEYIDLKETNVSVYLKRGVFDDEIADDLDWRRSGRLPVDGHIKDENLITGASDEEVPLRSGRRLDDSVFDSGGDHNKFEGSLMKLTAKPLDEPISPVTLTPMHDMEKIKFPADSIDRMKAVQEVLNKRRYDFTSTTENGRRRMNVITSQSTPHYSLPVTPDIWPDILSGRRFNPHDPSLISAYQSSLINPARTAVPPPDIGDGAFWKIPYLATSTRGPTLGLYDVIVPKTLPTKPRPFSFNWDPIRPSPQATPRPTNTPEPGRVITIERIPEAETAKAAEEFDRLGKKMGEQDLESSRQKLRENLEFGNEDYDVDPKGVPSRKKRRTVSTKFPDIFTMASGRKTQDNDMDGKGFPNRYKREIIYSSNSESSFFDKLSKPSDVFNTETAPKIYGNDIKEILSRKKRNIVSRSSTNPSTFGKLSKSSDVFNTETVPKLYENNVDAQEISNAKKRQIVSRSSTNPSTFGKLSKSSDMFNIETVPKLHENNVDAQEIANEKKKQIVSSSCTIPSTFGKLSKSSDVFNTETVPKLYDNNVDAQEILNGKKKQIVSSSSTIPSTFGKLSKSSDVFNTETVPKLYENNVHAREIANGKKRQFFSSSTTNPSTFGKLSKSSDVFNTVTEPKLYENNVDAHEIANKKKRQFVPSSSTTHSTLGKLSKSSDEFNTATVSKMFDSDIEAKKIPSRKLIRKVSSSCTIPSTFDKISKSVMVSRSESVDNMHANDFGKGILNMKEDNIVSISNTFPELSKSSDAFHTEAVYNKKISRRSKSSSSGSIPIYLGKQSSRQNSQTVSSSNTFSPIFRKPSKFSEERSLQKKGISSRQNSHIVSSSTYLSIIPGKLSKSSELLQTENQLKIEKNNLYAKKVMIRMKRRITSSSSYLFTTPSKLTSDVFNSESMNMNKIHKTLIIDKLLSMLLGIN